MLLKPIAKCTGTSVLLRHSKEFGVLDFIVKLWIYGVDINFTTMGERIIVFLF